MKLRLKKLLSLLAFFILTGVTAYAQQQIQQDPDMIWFNASLPAEERIEALISAMTVEEKISQLLDVSAAIPRLGIEEYNWWNECLHGVARNGRATVFPQAIAFGATFDEELIYDVATAISDEARAKFNIAREMGNTGRYAGTFSAIPAGAVARKPMAKIHILLHESVLHL